jgi:putative ABC transport system ATP-binding protein
MTPSITDGTTSGAARSAPRSVDPASTHGVIVELRDVVKSYGAGPNEVRALTDVSLSVAPGEFIAVRGPSGCGKSSLLHLAGGLEDPSAGRVFVDGTDLHTLDAVERASLRRRDIGYVFQRLNLVSSLTAVENVMLPLELDGTRQRDARRLALEALAQVGLDQLLDRYPDDFSGGQQQRIAIARAIVGTRRLVLADEPTGSLDTRTGDSVIELLASLPAERGTAVVLVTHEPRYASWAERVVSMRDGRVVDITSAPDAHEPALAAR